MGVDDFALRLLGPLDRIEAPLVGKTLKRDRADIMVRRGRHKARALKISLDFRFYDFVNFSEKWR